MWIWIIWNRIVYLYKMDLALNNLQKLICHKNQPTNEPLHNRDFETFSIAFRALISHKQFSPSDYKENIRWLFKSYWKIMMKYIVKINTSIEEITKIYKSLAGYLKKKNSYFLFQPYI